MQRIITALALALCVVLPVAALPSQHPVLPSGFKPVFDVHFCPKGMLIQCKDATTFFTWEELAVYRRLVEQMESKEKGTSL